MLLSVNLGIRRDDSFSELIVLLIHSANLTVQLIGVHSCHLLVHLNLRIIVAIGFFELIVLLIELVDVVEELDVLLLSFDESSDNFVDVVDTSGFHDCLKGFLNNLGIAHILIK